MNRKTLLRIACTVFSILMVLSMAACSSTQAPTTQPAASVAQTTTEATVTPTTEPTEQPPLEYSIWYSSGAPGAISKIANNPNDVVTPYVEKKFNIKIKDFQVPDSATGDDKQAIAMFIAANNVPDVMSSSQQNCHYFASTGQFADLTDLIAKDMPDYSKYISQSTWPRWAEADGKHYVLPYIGVDLNQSQYADNPYLYGNSGWAMWVREDILAKCGYSFTPIAQIKAETTDKGIVPTMDQLAITPAIDTPEKWVDFLKKVKALNLKVGDKSVIPLSVVGWSVFHFSAMYDNGHWRKDANGNVSGWLGTPDAKPFYDMWRQMYQEGLIDQDYVTQKDDQLQQKVASGLVACGLYVPDLNAARQANLQRDPSADLRPIPWPKEHQDLGYFDINEGGFQAMVINKNFSDIPRLLQFFNWFYTDEGMDIMTWGPESAGLWEMKDGKKVFKADIADDIVNNNTKGKNADYYGIFDPLGSETCFQSEIGLSAPVCNISTADWRLSYPTKLDIYSTMSKVFTKNQNMCVDYKGVASYGDNGPNCTAVNNYYWNTFVSTDIAELLQAKDETAYDKAWDDVYAKFVKATNYDQAQQDMVAWFNKYGAK